MAAKLKGVHDAIKSDNYFLKRLDMGIFVSKMCNAQIISHMRNVQGWHADRPLPKPRIHDHINCEQANKDVSP
ncbi:hypothetical protein BKI51_13725 [Alphaproteobacteria bacterium AO1-B]|nr:hypothetical protein BKI51_13725 [Alphaproteobacteria bacterium AO1-B]